MKTKASYNSSEQGLTLVEALVALVILLIALATVVPFFLNNQVSTIRNEIRLGAVSVSQRIMDELRRTDAASLPSSGSVTTLPSGGTTTSLNYAGKTYSATITYCQTTTLCDANSRQILVQVFHGGQNVYQVETVYTRLE